METLPFDKMLNSFSYEEYRMLILTFAIEKTTSGELNEDRIFATNINAQRIKRIEKQYLPSESIKQQLDSITEHCKWIVITESWCGDGAQCIPVIAKMAEQNSLIDLKLIFRDDNLEIMDQFLTNGTRSIPKLIVVRDNEVILTWGPRPKLIQVQVNDYKTRNPKASKKEINEFVHLTYAKDKYNSIEKDFLELLKTINNTHLI